MKDFTMSITENLLAELRAAYPTLTFDTQDKAASGYAGDGRYADTLIGVVTQDVLIVDSFESSCGRFTVNPEEAHGIPGSAAVRIATHNLLPAQTSSTSAP